MKIFNELSENKNLALGLGFFDGVHIGHQNLIKSLYEESKKRNIKSALITFSQNPINYFSKQKIPNITTNPQKIELIEKLGIDYLYILDFSLFKETEANDYLYNIIIKNFSPKLIMTGFNHTFGKNKKGNPKFLNKKSKEFGYEYIELEEQKLNNKKISSTIIRNYLQKGQIEKANKLLNRNFEIEGNVIKGNQIARKLGYKTANIIPDETIVKLPYGVYFGNVIIQNKTFKSLISYGVKPTFTNDKKVVLESHILDFNQDIYDEKIIVQFEKQLRKEKKFKNFDELKKQLDKDYLEFKKFCG